LPTAHTALSVAFYLLHKAVGDGAMNKFGTKTLAPFPIAQ